MHPLPGELEAFFLIDRACSRQHAMGPERDLAVAGLAREGDALPDKIAAEPETAESSIGASPLGDYVGPQDGQASLANSAQKIGLGVGAVAIAAQVP